MPTLLKRRLRLLERISRTVTKEHLEDSYLDVDTMRVLLRARGISTLAQYREWHVLNRIQWAPRSPTAIPGYMGANHLFGTVHHSIPMRKDSEIITYEELRRIIAPLKLQSMQQYIQWHETLTNLEQYVIPKYPNSYYKRLGTWRGTTHFLGKDIVDLLTEIKEEKRFWVLFHVDGDERGTIRVGDYDTVSLKTLMNDSTFIPVAFYEYEKDMERFFKIQIDSYTVLDEYDEYNEVEERSNRKRSIPNLSPLLFELDTNLLKVTKRDIMSAIS